MPGSHRLARAGSLLATVVLVLAATPAAVSADGAISHSGKYGVHLLIDSEENPGGTCTYNVTQTLKQIRVRWPHMEGYDRTAGRDFQKVSWRFQVFRDTGGGPALYATTPLTFAHTYDDEAAFWPSRTFAFTGDTPEGSYSIHVQMYWYRADNTVRGIAVHHVDYLKPVGLGLVAYASSCPFEG